METHRALITFLLSRAAEHDHQEIVDLLLERVDYIHLATQRAQRAGGDAVCGGSVWEFVLVRQLLETYSYDTSSHGRITGPSCQLCPTVLCLTVDRGHEEESVELLLAHGADTISVAFLDLQFTQYYLLLLAAGADPYYASALLNTLLLQLAIRGGPAVFQVPL